DDLSRVQYIFDSFRPKSKIHTAANELPTFLVNSETAITSDKKIAKRGKNMGRAKPIEWPDKAKICATFIVPWEVWPENFATHQPVKPPGGATLPQPKAVLKQNRAWAPERKSGAGVGIWKITDLFDRHNLKVTFLMNGRKVEQFADECREFKAKGHEFSS